MVESDIKPAPSSHCQRRRLLLLVEWQRVDGRTDLQLSGQEENLHFNWGGIYRINYRRNWIKMTKYIFVPCRRIGDDLGGDDAKQVTVSVKKG